jgi:DNA-binding beta-propeller fold protein YncE
MRRADARLKPGATGMMGIATAALCGVLLAWPAVHAQSTAPLKPVGTIPLPKVAGRIDHLAFDAARQHLFVAALGNNTVEVVDVAKNQHLQSLPGFHEPQGIAVVADLNGVAIANGESGTLQMIDAQSFKMKWTTSIAGDADNVRYDATAKRLYVAAEGGLYAIDPSSGKKMGRLAIEGHPESFQIESAGTRVFANLPGLLSAQIIAADRKSMNVSGHWSPGCSGNYPMALDESTSRLFVGCRRPSRLAVIDSRSGKVIGSTETVGDTDDLFYDAPRQRIYVIGGEGFVDVLQRRSDSLERLARVPTRSGARTGLWVPQLNRLFVAVPARSGERSEIRIFEG